MGTEAMNPDTIVCDQANLANGWVSRMTSRRDGSCRKCRVVAVKISGSISKATIEYTPFLITSKAGLAMFNITGLCEPCATEVFKGHEVVLAQAPAKRYALLYRQPQSHKWVLVREPDGKMLDMGPLDENILVIEK
jgi:hypothetical protein